MVYFVTVVSPDCNCKGQRNVLQVLSKFQLEEEAPAMCYFDSKHKVSALTWFIKSSKICKYLVKDIDNLVENWSMIFNLSACIRAP